MKICTNCLKEKPLSDFSLRKGSKDGFRAQCKECRSIKGKQYYNDNKERYSAHKKQWYIANREQSLAYSNQRRADNIEHYRKQNRQYYNDNKEKILANKKQYYINNREYIDAWNKQWRIDNPEKVKKCAERVHKKQRGIPKGRLNHSISSGINSSLRKGIKAGRRWELLVDFTVNQLKLYLETQFKLGMNWENYGEWHIDHKIPIAVFNFEKPEDIDFKKCWALENLQPLWAKENMSKGAKLDKHFQPSFAFGGLE